MFDKLICAISKSINDCDNRKEAKIKTSQIILDAKSEIDSRMIIWMNKCITLEAENFRLKQEMKSFKQKDNRIKQFRQGDICRYIHEQKLIWAEVTEVINDNTLLITFPTYIQINRRTALAVDVRNILKPITHFQH